MRARGSGAGHWGPREAPRGVRGNAPSKQSSQIPGDGTDGLVEHLGELSDERGDIPPTHRIGHGHRVRQQKPDGRGGERPRHQTDRTNDAHADSYEAHLPIALPLGADAACGTQDGWWQWALAPRVSVVAT